MDGANNLVQWIFMIAPKNIFLKKMIDEMVNRINNNVNNIFIATGPTLFNDVIYNHINNTNIFNTNIKTRIEDRGYTYIEKLSLMNGHIIEEDKNNNKSKFKIIMDNYNVNMIYNNDIYIPTWNSPTPNFYKY